MRTAYTVRLTIGKLDSSKASKKVKFNELFAQDIITMTRMHMIYLSFKIARTHYEKINFSCKNIKPILELLCRVFALKQLQLESAPCFDTGFFGAGSNDLLNEAMKAALVELRPHMIPLVEIKVGNYDINALSSIGNEFGDIYENQLENAINSKLNEKPRPEYWESLMKPIYTGAKL